MPDVQRLSIPSSTTFMTMETLLFFGGGWVFWWVFFVEKLKWTLMNWKLKSTSDLRYEFTTAIVVQDLQQWNTSILWRYLVTKLEDYDHRITFWGRQNETLTKTTEFLFPHPPLEEPGQWLAEASTITTGQVLMPYVWAPKEHRW